MTRAARVEAFQAASRATVDRSMLLFALLVVVGALLSTADADVVKVFGFDVPVLCTWRRLTGESCPGCGLTRSFTLVAHGRLLEAWSAHRLGPLAFLVIAAQVPWRAWRLWAHRPTAEVTVANGGRSHAPDQRRGGTPHS